MAKLNRNEFLKLAGSALLGSFAPRLLYQPALSGSNNDQKSILIIVFDALSSHHISLYGYPRKTMPNLSRLAQKAIVYHNHYSGGNFTTPGTASLLTGVLPWTHRAIDHNDTLDNEFLTKNIFHEFGKYHRLAYSHNILVNTLLRQLLPDITEYIPRGELFLSQNKFVNLLFEQDEDVASVSWNRIFKKKGYGYSYALYFSMIYDLLKKINIEKVQKNFPRGLPFVNGDEFFILEDSINFLQKTLPESPQPFLGYFHLLPPHYPYRTRDEFYQVFSDDGFMPIEKPEHVFSRKYSQDVLDEWHTWYDEFILYADAEFARLYDWLETSGILENTWLILTSDHGELFERGVVGHKTPMMFQPVINIPLLIFEPGRQSRLDVFHKSSNIDLLPTLLSITNQEIPEWIEGEVLPPFTQNPGFENKDVLSMNIIGSNKNQPIVKASIALYRGQYKLIYYFGYNEIESDGGMVELFDLGQDPGELNDLADEKKEIADAMLAALKSEIEKRNKPFV